MLSTIAMSSSPTFGRRHYLGMACRRNNAVQFRREMTAPPLEDAKHENSGHDAILPLRLKLEARRLTKQELGISAG
ncbi:hypothetical protein NKH36_05580 [Mesorhizobium sp. M1312]|uniref:hypothetical protein n=1 Tax=unclassified Mesorhizobium TaxID=325217 RepID=UPI003339A507